MAPPGPAAAKKSGSVRTPRRLNFFLQDAAAYVQTIRTNRHTQGSKADDFVADHALRFLAERTLDDILHAEK
jgi:hypothetical protein